MENLSSIMELLGAFITGIVGPILYFLFTRMYRDMKDKQTDKVRETVKNTSIIENELEEIRIEFEADRVWLAQFHNGGNFYPTGKSIQKFSIFYEVIKPGISSIVHTYSNIPTSLYSKTFSHLMKDEGIFISDFEDETVSTFGLKSYSESTASQSCYILPLFSLDDKFMGMIGVDFVIDKEELTKDEWEHFQIYAGRIAGYLSNYLDK